MKIKTYLGLLICALTGFNSAATISWSINNVTGDSDVYNAGTLVYAYAQQGQSVSTINGVTFADFASGASDFSISSVGTTGNSTAFYNGAAYSAGLNAFLATEYYATGSTTASVTMTLNNLTIGTSYIVNTFTSDDRAGWENWYTTTLDGISLPQLGGTGNIPKVLLGSFIADATTQSYTIQSDRALGGGVYANLSGFSLSSVPEPSTYGMMIAILVLGVVVFRRKTV